MKLLIGIAIALLFPLSAHAVDVEIYSTFIPPTHYVDGSPIQEGDLVGYNFYYGVTQGSADLGIESLSDGSATSYTSQTFVDLPNGAYVYLRVTALTANGDISVYSNEHAYGPFEQGTVEPNAPTGVGGAGRIVSCDSGYVCSQ